ncbi:hypothetical protein D3C86_1727430 [compost metagenome]
MAQQQPGLAEDLAHLDVVELGVRDRPELNFPGFDVDQVVDGRPIRKGRPCPVQHVFPPGR